MRTDYKDILDPNNLLVDDRSISDMILLLKKLSSKFSYYNRKNKPEGNFSSLIETDESFLIAEILNFNVAEEDQKRLNLIANFDNSSSEQEKEKIFSQYIILTSKMLNHISNWYSSSQKNNLTEFSSNIELELELAIENILANSFHQFKNYLSFFKAKELIDDTVFLNENNYKSVIWKIGSNKEIEPIFDYEDRIELINNCLKKVILISSDIFNIIYSLSNKSKKLIEKSLYRNNNHKAHIGLLFSFLELMKYVKKDINTFSKKHLDLFYKTILKQELLSTEPLKTFITLEIEENSNEITLTNDNLLTAGQYENGSLVKLQMQEDIILNNVRIAELLTVFISRNSDFDFNSNYQLIASIYFRKIANSIAEVNSFNSNETTFSTLGRDQNSLTSNERTMHSADVGFLISSSILKLDRSDRKIKIDLKFSIASINYLSDLIIDISNNTELNEEEVFYRVFSKAFDIQYTTEQGWYNVDDYEIIAPDDWTLATITLIINLNKLAPGFNNLDTLIHD